METNKWKRVQPDDDDIGPKEPYYAFQVDGAFTVIVYQHGDPTVSATPSSAQIHANEIRQALDMVPTLQQLLQGSDTSLPPSHTTS